MKATMATTADAAATTDLELVERVRAGELPQFELLVRRHNPTLFRVLRSMLGNEADAFDAMQDAWVQAWRALGQYEGRARFSTWLVRIGVRAALAARRRDGRLVPVGVLPDGEEATMRTPEDAAAGAELRAMLERAVDELPEALRTVLVLRQIEGLSTRETADCLALSEEAVKVRLHRARGALREAVEQRVGSVLGSIYGFHLVHCDRITWAVMERVARDEPS